MAPDYLGIYILLLLNIIEITILFAWFVSVRKEGTAVSSMEQLVIS